MSELNSDYEVAIIGAGFSGIAAAARLARSGVSRFGVFEQAAAPGGTWRDNVYPGCGCDVPSSLYSYSFAPNPNWSQMYSSGPEILAYLKDCIRLFSLESRLQLNARLVQACYEERRGGWRLRFANGAVVSTQVLVIATGALSRPHMPAIPGMDSADLQILHSARWDRTVSLNDKRVAVIGSGASAIQIVPSIATMARELSVFQRTPPWVLPRENRSFTSRERFFFRHAPALQQLHRLRIYLYNEALARSVMLGREWALSGAERMGRAHLRRQIPDVNLRARLTPAYRIGCKRILISDDYYPVFERPHVRLIDSALKEIRGRTLIAENGAQFDADIVVFATGFVVSELHRVFEIDVIGRQDRSLTQEWARSGMQALYGATIAGYPNLFFFLGPNTGLGHTSMIHMMESQANYLNDYVRELRRSGVGAALDVKPEAQAEYNLELQKRLATSIWSRGGCTSWYMDKDGRIPTLWPGSTFEFRRRTRRINLSDYHLTVPDLRSPS
jgi:cation diffusion facilitator CzcD-associated flavoprotein CzcO